MLRAWDQGGFLFVLLFSIFMFRSVSSIRQWTSRRPVQPISWITIASPMSIIAKQPDFFWLVDGCSLVTLWPIILTTRETKPSQSAAHLQQNETHQQQSDMIWNLALLGKWSDAHAKCVRLVFNSQPLIQMNHFSRTYDADSHGQSKKSVHNKIWLDKSLVAHRIALGKRH